MNKKIQKFAKKEGAGTLAAMVFIGVLFGLTPLFDVKNHIAEANLTNGLLTEGITTLQGNTLVSIAELPEPEVKERAIGVITGYSSTPWETDETPHITAAGTNVRDGVVANNLLTFGARIRIPEIYGNKIFVVEDRMNSRKGDYQFDIWFPSHREAKNFGAKITYVEILES